MSADNKILPFKQPANTATILVVDDEDGVRRLLAHWITSLGYTVKSAGDAAAALDVLKCSEVAVAVCDIRMPGNDGVWLIDHVRKEYPGTAVVIATGLPDMATTVTLQSGVAGYLMKPFQRQDLATVLNHAMMPDSPGVRDPGRQPVDTDSTPDI
jgi:two-component system nitrogen regulation response regulator GlnG